jgi:hypothetical protein
VKKILAGAVGGAAALTVILGAGPAGADNEYKGLTYERVQEILGGQAVISSRVGSFLPTEQCIVTGNRRASSAGGGGRYLVDLNCNDTLTDGHPGYSVATVQGEKAQQLKLQVNFINGDYERQTSAGEAPYCEEKFAFCKQICERSGDMCSPELSGYLGL